MRHDDRGGSSPRTEMIGGPGGWEAPGCAHRWLSSVVRRRRVVRLVLLVAMAVLPALGALPGVAVAASGYDAEELSFVRMLNDFRVANGRQPLLVSDLLSATAERHALDMGTYRFFSHVTEHSQRYPIGSECWDRLAYDGYTGSEQSGENLAAGARTASEAFTLWKGSSGHRANMLDPLAGDQRVVFRQVGVARVFVPQSPYGWYWAIEFGGALDATAHDPLAASGLPGPFADVPGDHPYAAAIAALAEDGVINGYDDGTFRPGTAVLRQHFAKMIVEMLDLPADEGSRAPFVDVADGGPSTLYPDNYIACAAEHGITNGVAPDRFAPTAPISRAQVVTMVVRAAQTLSPGSLADPDAGYAGPWAGVLAGSAHAASVRVAASNGLLDGLPVWSLDPWASMPRGEVAQVLHNLDAVMGTD